MHRRRCQIWSIDVAALGILLAGLAGLAGCGAGSHLPPASQNTVSVNGGGGGVGGGRSSADQAVGSDPCAVRLQNVEGVMLQYYALYHHLPATLDELLPLADVDQPLSFVCPDTGRPYTYEPAGLGSANQQKKIIVYDSVPHPNGSRWCILMPPMINRKNGSLSMEVVSLPEAAFRQFYPPD